MRPRIAQVLFLAAMLVRAAQGQDSSEIYEQRCSVCHSGGVDRAPAWDALQQMSPQTVLRALEQGAMKAHARSFTGEQRRALAEYVSGKALGDPKAKVDIEAHRCETSSTDFADALQGPHWNGWGVDDRNTRFQPADMAKLNAEDVPKLKLRWAFAFPGDVAASSQPTVAGGRLFVGSRSGAVYSLDAKTGCVHWVFESHWGVRSAFLLDKRSDGSWVGYFGDSGARVYAVDALTGALIWSTEVDDHSAAVVTGGLKLHRGRLYVPVSSFEEATGSAPSYECCTFRGSVTALDAATGKQLWKTYTVRQEPKKVRKNRYGVQLWGPSGSAIWSSPTVDPKRNALYVTTGDNYSDPPDHSSDAVTAIDLETGELLWSRQFTAGDAYVISCVDRGDDANCPEARGPDLDFGSSAILIDQPDGKSVLVAGQKSGVLHAMDPDKEGQVLWQTRVGKGGVLGGIQWGPASDGEKVYVALSDISFGSSGINPKTGGGLTAIDVATGEIRWQAPPTPCDRPGCSPAQSAAVTVIPGVVFSGDLAGRLRAYSTGDGAVLWKFDTIRAYETVNGVEGKGGAINGPGPVVVDGTVYVNSGYGQFGSIPGNVLLAFSAEE